MYFYFHLFFTTNSMRKLSLNKQKSYPDLKADTQFTNLQGELSKIETDIARYLIKNFLSKFCKIKQESIFSSRVLISLSSNVFTSYYMV